MKNSTTKDTERLLLYWTIITIIGLWHFWPKGLI